MPASLSPYISLCLPVSPCISLYLPVSPQARTAAAWRALGSRARCTARAAPTWLGLGLALALGLGLGLANPNPNLNPNPNPNPNPNLNPNPNPNPNLNPKQYPCARGGALLGSWEHGKMRRASYQVPGDVGEM